MQSCTLKIQCLVPFSLQFLIIWWLVHQTTLSSFIYYPGQKNWDNSAHVAQARDLSSTHAPMIGLRACLNFFGQGSTCHTYGRILTAASQLNTLLKYWQCNHGHTSSSSSVSPMLLLVLSPVELVFGPSGFFSWWFEMFSLIFSFRFETCCDPFLRLAVCFGMFSADHEPFNVKDAEAEQKFSFDLQQ